MKKLLFLLLAFFSFDSQAQFNRETSFDERPHCEEVGGVWRQFGNGCIDQCRPKFDKLAVCTRAVSSGCDCGKAKCWDGNNCIPLKEYSVIFEKEQSEEKLVLEKAKKSRMAEARQNQEEILARLSQDSKPAVPSKTNTVKKDAGDFAKQLTMPTMPTTNFPSMSDLSQSVEIPPFFKQQQQQQNNNQPQTQVAQNSADNKNNKSPGSGLVGALIGNEISKNSPNSQETIMPPGLPQIALPN